MTWLAAAYLLAQICCNPMDPVEIWVLEHDGHALTFDDLTESECQALLQTLWPHFFKRETLECVKYLVGREQG